MASNVDTSVNTSIGELCLSDQCIDEIAAALVTPIYQAKNKSTWCDGSGKSDGIYLVKNPKTASSTSAGVALRISHRQSCDRVRYNHAHAVKYEDRPQNQSYMFTTIRDPASRAISRVFWGFKERIRNITNTDELVLKKLEDKRGQPGCISDGQGGFQLRYLAPVRIAPNSFWSPLTPSKVQNLQELIHLIKKTMAHYDFILVTERMDESLVAMALLMGLDVGDVLGISSKVAASSFFYNGNHCKPLTKGFRSQKVQEYFDSPIWRAQNFGDYLLHRLAANALDRTISEQIGQERFHKALAKYQKLKSLGEKLCAPNAKFPCSSDGKPQLGVSGKSCYIAGKDFGCGYRCIDFMLMKLEGKKLDDLNATAFAADFIQEGEYKVV